MRIQTTRQCLDEKYCECEWISQIRKGIFLNRI